MSAEVRETIRSVWGDLVALGVEHVDLFGSCARGDAHADSDVDVMIHFRSTPSLNALVEVRDLLQRALGRDVDVLTPGALEHRPRLRDRVWREAVRVA